MKACLSALILATSLLRAEPDFTVWSYTEKDLFPSAIVSTATVDWNGDEQTAEDKKTEDDPKVRKRDIPIYGDENGWLAVELIEVPRGAMVEVEISIDGFMKPSKWKGKLTKVSRDGEARIFPKAAWDYDALLKVRQQRPVTSTYQVTINGTALPEQTETCVVRSINDCPFYVIWDEEGEDVEDFSLLFAAYVNENHPLVDEILKEALESGLVSGFTGYQSGKPKEVMMQVFAIWNVLQRRGIKYSDVSKTPPSKYVVTQTVRFLDDSIKATQANCVDGSVLMASILQKIGIQSYLVMVPGHCFLAFDSGPNDDDEIIGLETTILGNNDLKPISEMSSLSQKVKLKEFQASYKTFSHAVQTGNATLEEHADAFAADEDPNIQLISIAAARELGIMPIASSQEKR